MESESIFNRLIFALATASLEEPPVGNPTGPAFGTQLQDYHVAWTSLWSPSILGVLGFLPESRRCDSSGLDVENALVLVPELAQNALDQPLEERLILAGNKLIHSGSRSRREICEEILGFIRSSQSQTATGITPSEESLRLENDFCAFGFAVMQVQQMARKLRYSFNLDWMVVSDQLLQGAKSFNQGNFEDADRWLAAAYDSLSQERDRYCSQQGYLLHLVLTASNTLGSRFTKEMQNKIPTSLFATTQTLEKLRESNPDGFKRVSERLAEKSLSVAGGFAQELKHTYLSERSVHRSFQRAKRQAIDLGIPYPKVLLPFYPSVPAHLPALARSHGFQGSVMAKFLDGVIPEKEHAKLKWQTSSESPAIDTILGHTIDASDPQALLEIGSAMAKQLDYHQVPTLVLAHWPDRSSLIFEDLVRCTQRTPALGKWITADEYFQSTSQPYWSDQFGPQHFPFAIPSEPEKIHAIQISLLHLQRLLYGLERLADTLACWSLAANRQKTDSQLQSLDGLVQEIQQVLEELDLLAAHGDQRIENPETWTTLYESRANALEEKAADHIRRWLAQPQCWTVLNSASHPRRLSLVLPLAHDSIDPSTSDRILAASQVQADSSKTQIVLDVPPFGFSTIPFAKASSSGVSKPKPSGFFTKLLGQRTSICQSDGSLANEFMEVQVDPKKGHLRSLYIRDQRGNRLSGMVSLSPKPAGSHHRVSDNELIALSQLRIEQHQISDCEAVICTRGVFGGEPNSNTPTPWLEQTIRLQRGCKWVEVSFCGGGFDRRSHTPIWRMIWPSEATTLDVWTHGNRTKWLGPLQASVELIEIDDAQHKVYYATGGLSYHVKQASNQLQSLLPIDADGNLNAKLYLGIHWQRPWETAIDLFQNPWAIGPESKSRPPGTQTQSGTQAQSGWLAQCNHPNLRFSLLLPDTQSYFDGEQTIHPDVLIWVSENSGKSSTAKISLPKTARAAWKVDFSGQLLDKIPVDGSDLVVPYTAWEKSVLAVVFEI